MWSIKSMQRSSRIKKINKEFIEKISEISKQISKRRQNEEETRRWCVDILKSAMGYKGSEIETEFTVLGSRVDIALKDGDEVFMVIECKAANFNLNTAAVNQASRYAVALGAEWAVVTNGHNWQLYRVVPTKGIEPDVIQIFDIYTLDEDGISKQDAQYLYLLTKDAINSGETKKAYHEVNALSFERIQAALKSDQVLDLVVKEIQKSYSDQYGIQVSLKKEELSEILEGVFDVVDAMP